MPVGRNKVPMAPLREALSKAKYENVKTYIQSGNIILDTDLGKEEIETQVHDIIQAEFGGDINVIALDKQRFYEIFNNYPFKSAANEARYFTLLKSNPDKKRIEDLLQLETGDDEYNILNDVIYIRVATKYSDAKINNSFLEKKLGVAASTRNHNTMQHLAELLQNY